MFIRPIEDWIAILIVTVGAVAILSSCETAHAETITNDKAVHAILGEARGEGYAGMYAVACAIRNRGTLEGVYGAGADISDARPQTWARALSAWQNSATGPDVTHGATHWESTDFDRPYWAQYPMVETFRIEKHIFYKRRR